MSRFHSLKISDVRREAEASVSVAFEVDRHLKRAFAFKQGQFLTLRAIVGGREVKRCYSICSGTNETELRIAIKRVEGGIFSNFALSKLHAGQMIDVMQPQGNFYVPLHPTASRTYLLCATGSGITPIYSIIKSVLAHEPSSKLLLFYGNRTKADALFLEDIERLSRETLRLTVFNFYTRETPSDSALSGRLDGRAISLGREVLGNLQVVDACFLCGATGMIMELREQFSDAGVDREKIFYELFDALPDAGDVPPDVVRGAVANLIIDGKRVSINLGSSTVLDAALEQGIDIPYSCRTGSCSTCVARIVEGRAHMMCNNSLEKWAVDKGFVLSCQTRSLAPELTLEFGVELTAE